MTSQTTTVADPPSARGGDVSTMLDQARQIPEIAAVLDAYAAYVPFAPLPVVAQTRTIYATGANS